MAPVTLLIIRHLSKSGLPCSGFALGDEYHVDIVTDPFELESGRSLELDEALKHLSCDDVEPLCLS